MEWFFPGAFWAAFTGAYVPSYQASTGPENVPARPGHVDADLLLIRTGYEFMLAEERCARCAAPLGGRLRLVPVARRPPAWQGHVETRCRGWRRHTAVVTEVGNDLRLGPFKG